MPSVTLYPSGHTLGTNGANFLNPINLRANDGVYSTVTQTAKNTTSQIFLESFDFSAIPSGATINSIIVNVERKMSSTSSIQSVAIQAYKAGVAMGTKATNTTEPASDTVLSNANTGTWAYADLVNLRVLLENIRGNSTAACTVSYDYVSVTVDYTEPVDTRIASGTFESNGTFNGLSYKTGSSVGTFDSAGAFNGSANKQIEEFCDFNSIGGFFGQSFRLIVVSGAFETVGSFFGDGNKQSVQSVIFGGVGSFEGQHQKITFQIGSFDSFDGFIGDATKMHQEQGTFESLGGFDGVASKIAILQVDFNAISSFIGETLKVGINSGSFESVGSFDGTHQVIIIEGIRMVNGSFQSASGFTGSGLKIAEAFGSHITNGEFIAEALKIAQAMGGFDSITMFEGTHVKILISLAPPTPSFKTDSILSFEQCFSHSGGHHEHVTKGTKSMDILKSKSQLRRKVEEVDSLVH